MEMEMKMANTDYTLKAGDYCIKSGFIDSAGKPARLQIVDINWALRSAIFILQRSSQSDDLSLRINARCLVILPIEGTNKLENNHGRN